MSMLIYKKNAIYKLILWYGKLSTVFIKKSAFQVFALIFLNIVSQISLLLATALPLKIVILMGSERTPRYFPSFMAEIDRNDLIYILAIASVIFWLIFLILGFLSARVSRVTSSNVVLADSAIPNMKAKEMRVAVRAYSYFIKSISEIVFSIAAFILIFFVYPAVAYVCLIYLLMVYLFLVMIYSINNSKKIIAVRRNIYGWLSSLSNIGFFVAFMFMIYDFTNGSMPGLLNALISVIFSRQLLRSHIKSLIGLYNLYRFNKREVIYRYYVGL